MITSSNMGLTVWNTTADPYDHSQLATNFLRIDSHNHTDTNGVKIPSAGIEDSAITSGKIANNAVTAAKIPDGSLGPEKLSFGVSKVGDVQMVWTPNGLTSLQPWFDDGWLIANGQVVEEVEHDFDGGGIITLPNMNGKFPIGGVQNSGGANLPSHPAIGQEAGSNTIDLSHTHTLDARNIQYTQAGPTNPYFFGYGYGYGWGYGYGLNAVGTTNSALSTLKDNRPASIGFIFLIKVKN